MLTRIGPWYKESLIETLLFWATSYNRTKLVKELVTYSANFNTCDGWGKTPLMIAAQNGNMQIVQVLTEAGADLDTKGQTALIYATHDIKVVDASDYDIKPIPSLKHCNQRVIVKLLEVRATVQYKIFDIWGSTHAGTEREAWQLLPGRSLKTVALLPAA